MKLFRIVFSVLSVSALCVLCGQNLNASTATATAGSTVTISVAHDGTAPFTYQWRKDGVDLPGATNATLLLVNVTRADAGAYTVRVANDAGSILSDEAVIAIKGQPPTKATTTITLNVSLTIETTAMVSSAPRR